MREAVTLLFTDIQGSTRLWETEPRAMSLALRAHDALCREAVRDHAGVVVKMTGDGLYAAFDRPPDAAGAAVQLLRALADPARTAGLAIRSRCARSNRCRTPAPPADALRRPPARAPGAGRLAR